MAIKTRPRAFRSRGARATVLVAWIAVGLTAVGLLRQQSAATTGVAVGSRLRNNTLQVVQDSAAEVQSKVLDDVPVAGAEESAAVATVAAGAAATRLPPGSFEAAVEAVARETSENLKLMLGAFTGFLTNREQVLKKEWEQRFAKEQEKGIIVVAGSSGTLANTFVNLYVLRHTVKCKLPFSVVYWGRVKWDTPSEATMKFMKDKIPNLSFIDASKLPFPKWHRSLDGDDGSRYGGWKLKGFAIYAAPYRQMIFLDSDNLAVRDPELLFDQPAYKKFGNMWWPDSMCGNPGLYNEVGMPDTGKEAQTESGQIVFDRQRHWRVLEWILWLNTNDHITWRHTYGDKDTFRVAHFFDDKVAGRQEETYYQVPYPLSFFMYDSKEEAGFRMRGYLQCLPDGTSFFVHRASANKFDPKHKNTKPISHITTPSCGWFRHRFGTWNAKVMNHTADYFQPEVHTPSKKDGCSYSLDDMVDAVKRCGNYDPAKASGTDKPPVFEVPKNTPVWKGIQAAEKAYLMLIDARTKNEALF